MCAIFGVWDHEEASRIAYLGLFALQHRGQESSGIVTLNNAQDHLIHRGLGLVADVFKDADLKKLEGRHAVGHNRYSTTGQNLIANAQPITAQLLSGPLAVAHNGNIVNTRDLKKNLQSQGAIFHGTSDTEILLHLLSRTTTSDLIEAMNQVTSKLEGAFSLVILSHNKMIAVRDPMGFRPLSIGRKMNDQGKEAIIFSSETCAFDLIGARYDREIEPGELFWVDENGEHSIKNFLKAEPVKQCIFEHVYFSRPDSVVFGQSVYESRKSFGRWLAKETAVDADLVIPVPDSGVPAAIGYSQESGLPFEFGIIRNHYIGRTFIQPQQSIRGFGVKIKLNPQSAVLKGKRVIVVDDSLVRGTTSQKIVSLIRAAGAKEVHMRIASPPTTGPCYYGVDTPQKDALIASHKSIQDIAQFIEADSLAYLSSRGLHEALREARPAHAFVQLALMANIRHLYMMKKWQGFKLGDVIDIVAPGSGTTNEELLQSVAAVKAWGLQPRFTPEIFSGHPFLSHEDEFRFRDLKRALTAKDSVGIWCLRGGYGSLKIIPSLLKLKAPVRSKLLIGYSDISSLHLFLRQKWQWVTCHAPLFESLGKDKHQKLHLEELREVFFGQPQEITHSGLQGMNTRALKVKRLEGVLAGGNLVVLASHCGTRLAPQFKGKVVFFEEINERGYRIDRLLEQLVQATDLADAKAILLGDFIGGAEKSGENFGDTVLRDFSLKVKLPVFKGLPIGHGPVNRPLFLGTKSILQNTQGTYELVNPTGVER